MKQLPEEFQKEMRGLLKDEFDAYLESYEKPRFYGLRVNTDKISVEDFLKISPFKLRPIPWCHNGFYYEEEERPAKHPFYYAGLYYLQEPSAMMPAESLPVTSTDVVLDVCAAPGGKSTALLNKKPSLLITNDISNSRAQALLKNLELFGGTDYVCLSEDPQKFTERFQGVFDKILIDAPCSGEGMFRKEPLCIKAWLEHGHDYYVNLQKSIAKNCLSMLKDGGQMVYSTCTFSQKEDEEIISYLKALDESVKVQKIETPYEGFSHGIYEKSEDSNLRLSEEELSNLVRIFPHKTEGEGHFVALVQKGEKPSGVAGKCESLPLSKISGFQVLSDETKEFLRKVTKLFKPGKFELRQEHLAYVPELPVSLSGLRIVRCGLYLGECKKNRFEPSQSLAMALKQSEFSNTISFTAEDENVIRYLKGETVILSEEPTAEDGYVLICVEGYPLGFAKKKGTTLKNHYLSGWRMMS